ncbi:palmitoleoyl-protein carboxylesterase NOTUM [Periplaneta americana]|uniref:palmitoleoyl-protein carboxylesterase NOTUM n=1 Tax=Periplaneta americana TaxID=6978 RepID=UPI0037E98DA3
MAVLLLLLLAVGLRAEQQESSSSNLVTQDANSTLSTIQRLIQILQRCGIEETRALKRVFLSTPNITCNDGSPAGFYLRRSHGSRRWIVFLEGGWYCYDQRSCHSRWQRLRHLMTSRHWPETRSVGGILSMNPEDNQFWWNANHVLVPYCTSDSWSGTRVQPTAETRFSFMGALVVRQVVQDLLPLGLGNASLLLLAGSSAGGTGVMVNLNPVAALLPHVSVRGVSDSGWFLDRAPYSQDGQALAPLDAVKKGIQLWQGQVPSECRTLYPLEPWRCYFGYRAYPTLTAPLFVFQWLFDEAQMTADNVGAPVTKQQWDYIHQMGDSLRGSFCNVTAVFAPSCISHSVLTKKDWQSVKIDEVSLPQALRCWEMSAHSGTGLGQTPLPLKLARNLVRSGTSPTVEAPQRRRKTTGNNKGKKKKGTRPRQRRAVEGCTHHLIEHCSWPQCNHSCPRLTNPFTGQEMDFIELLKSFGLDMMSVANALGIDMHTLNNMDHEELLNLLTQRAN